MYGTVANLRVKAGKADEIGNWMDRWNRERAPRIKGPVATYVYRMDDEPQNLIAAVIFADKESYVANAEDPEQDRWFQEMRQLLEADPEWHDGEVIYSMTD